MQFKIGDKIQIILREQTFYSGTYNLTTCKGTVQRINKSCAYIKFGNLKTSLAVLCKDLELLKNRQLLFDFMEC